MREHGFNVGGEQSGHIILSDYTTTGDGFVAALQVLAVVKKHDRPVSEVCHRFDPLPQMLKNVRYKSGKPLENAKVRSAIKDGERRLNGHGRLVIRPSGTEPVIRVMGEGDDKVLVEEVVDGIVEALNRPRPERPMPPNSIESALGFVGAARSAGQIGIRVKTAFFLCRRRFRCSIDSCRKNQSTGLGSAASMIVCSCNVLSDRDVRTAVDGRSAPRTAGQVYGCLGCSPQCGRCARTIRRIMDEAVAAASRLPVPRQRRIASRFSRLFTAV